MSWSQKTYYAIVITSYTSEDAKSKIEREKPITTPQGALSFDAFYLCSDKRQLIPKFYKAAELAAQDLLSLRITVRRNTYEVMIDLTVNHD